MEFYQIVGVIVGVASLVYPTMHAFGLTRYPWESIEEKVSIGGKAKAPTSKKARKVYRPRPGQVTTTKKRNSSIFEAIPHEKIK